MRPHDSIKFCETPSLAKARPQQQNPTTAAWNDTGLVETRCWNWKAGRGKTRESNRSSALVPAILGAHRGAHMWNAKPGTCGGDLRGSHAQRKTPAVESLCGASLVFDTPRRDFPTEHLDRGAFQNALNSMHWLPWIWSSALSGAQGWAVAGPRWRDPWAATNPKKREF